MAQLQVEDLEGVANVRDARHLVVASAHTV